MGSTQLFCMCLVLDMEFWKLRKKNVITEQSGDSRTFGKIPCKHHTYTKRLLDYFLKCEKSVDADELKRTAYSAGSTGNWAQF